MTKLIDQKSILISVIIPVYNVEEYIDKCIESVVKQTHNNIEIIIVDDCSTDNSGVIIDKWAEKDPRIISIHNNKNIGVNNTRNIALDIAKGDYISFVDSDDWVEPSLCEIALMTAVRHKADIVCFGYFHVNTNGEKYSSMTTKNPKSITSEEGIRELIARQDVIYSIPWNKLYHKNTIKNVRFPKQKIFEDQGFTYLTFHNAEKIYVDNHILYNYLQRKNSLSADWDRPEALKSRFEIWLKRLLFIKEHYPNLEDIQVKQLAEECFRGDRLLSSEKNYMETRNEMKLFLKQHKKMIVGIMPKKAMIYYYFKPIFYLYYFLH